MIDNKFLIVSPTYNTAPFIEKCILSALNQTYKNFDYIVVNDCSTDGTRKIIDRLHEEFGGFTVCHNTVRTESPLGNFVKGIDLMPSDGEDIIVTLDGDDWLYDNNVLEYLNEVYQNQHIWMTYGQFISASGRIKDYCKQLTNPRTYRKHDQWVTSHLRTIKRKLWNKINKRDLLDRDGNYYVYYPDTAYMFPALEMAGLKHSRFIDKVLYVYNDRNPLCSADDWKVRKGRRAIDEIAKEIRRKPLYPELRVL